VVPEVILDQCLKVPPVIVTQSGQEHCDAAVQAFEQVHGELKQEDKACLEATAAATAADKEKDIKVRSHPVS
jgi:hypothetical protein